MTCPRTYATSDFDFDLPPLFFRISFNGFSRHKGMRNPCRTSCNCDNIFDAKNATKANRTLSRLNIVHCLIESIRKRHFW